MTDLANRTVIGIRTPEQIAEDHRAAELRNRGFSYRQIAEHLGCAVSTAFDRVARAIDDIPRESTQMLRDIEAAKLDERERITLGILGKKSPKVSASGHVVRQIVDGQWVTVEDDDVKLRALGVLMKISERRAKLFGLDAALQVEMTTVVYDGGTIEGQVEQLRRLFEQAGGGAVLLDATPDGERQVGGREARAITAGEFVVEDIPLLGGTANWQDEDSG
jgi:hypothetical protein